MSVQRFTFGPFELDPMRLELRRDGVRLNVGARACRVLVALVERSGQVVTQQELMAAGWSGLHVADVNLRVHIVALRKALSGGSNGEFDITTVPREGYIFAGPTSPAGGAAGTTPRPPKHTIPRQLTTLFGRSEALARLSDAVASHRIVTIVGPGGIGKTSLAMAAIAQYADAAAAECVFVDFSTSVSSLHVGARLFDALELEGSGEAASFRFLETMRVYARLKLLEGGEAARVYARFVNHTLVRMMAIDDLAAPDEDIMRRHSGILDEWRAAHDWSLRNHHWHAALRLMAEVIHLSESLNVRLEYVQRAIETLRMIPSDQQNEEVLWCEMRVCAHTADMLLLTQSPDPPNFIDLIEKFGLRSLRLAKQFNSTTLQMSSLVTLTTGALTGANVERVKSYALAINELAQHLQDPDAIVAAHYLNSYAKHYRSEFQASLRECDRSLDLAHRAKPGSSTAVEHVPSIRALRSLTLWLRGEFGSALAEMEEAHRSALSGGHVPTIAWLAWCDMLVNLWAGGLDRAADSAKLYEKVSSEYRNPGWSRYIPSAGEALKRLGNGRRSFDTAPIDWMPHVASHADMMTSIHCCFHRPEDLQRIKAAPQHWCAPEHFRAAGEHHLFAGRVLEAETFFSRALVLSKSAGAAAWEIRATISLARLSVRKDQPPEARALLEPLMERFIGCRENGDLHYAATVLAAC